MAVAIRIFRLIMPVADIERAARFYGSLLDQTGFRVSPGRHYLECGGVILQRDEKRSRQRRCRRHGFNTEVNGDVGGNGFNTEVNGDDGGNGFNTE